ncbi:MAG: glutamyl-tRNA(Gln) amidotransferase, subunit [Francisellaceae bacterium]|nr:glutamyl-tRNA(Gln) amidotransferase, subunit [Francisellaceae bacterium]
MKWEVVIGLEVHAQLATQSKIFSGSSTDYGAQPNTQANIIDLGMPGVLPVLNKEAVRMAVKFGLSINAELAAVSVFARKNYFYPDLPKGYQISQFELPIVGKGFLNIIDDKGQIKRIGITRAHLEEDAGKSLHENFQGYSGIDLNRAGVPLLEIVSEPDLRSANDAVTYLKTLHSLVRYLDICDGNMQEGSFRCDVNISLRPQGSTQLGTRAEIKNVNSFKFVEKAINYEIQRQMDILESGGNIIQETRLYDAERDETRSMRGKESANDYRYFPDPDLLPLEISPDFIKSVADTLPELPEQKRARFENQYSLSSYDANVLTATKELGLYFEEALRTIDNKDPKLVANWVMGELSAALNKSQIQLQDSPIKAQALGKLINRILDKTISGKIAKTIFEKMWQTGQDVDSIIETDGLKQVTDSGAIESIIDKVLQDNADKVQEYKNGKDKLFGFFIGLIMKESRGKANPNQVNELLKQKLS